MTEGLERLRKDYRAAFLRYLPRAEEAALHTAYTIGRGAVARGTSLIELVQIHHAVLVDVLRESADRDEIEQVATAAADFLSEVLASYEMTHRGFHEARVRPTGPRYGEARRSAARPRP